MILQDSSVYELIIKKGNDIFNCTYDSTSVQNLKKKK